MPSHDFLWNYFSHSKSYFLSSSFYNISYHNYLLSAATTHTNITEFQSIMVNGRSDQYFPDWVCQTLEIQKQERSWKNVTIKRRDIIIFIRPMQWQHNHHHYHVDLQSDQPAQESHLTSSPSPSFLTVSSMKETSHRQRCEEIPRLWFASVIVESDSILLLWRSIVEYPLLHLHCPSSSHSNQTSFFLLSM